MSEPDDMDAPVTRRELREELGQLENRIDKGVDQKFEIWAGALLERMNVMFMQFRAEMKAAMSELRQELQTDLARHTSAIFEHVSAQVAIIDEKYSDLPGRVTRLEEAERRRRPTRSRARPRR